MARRQGYRHPTAVVGDPPEHRDFTGLPICPRVEQSATLEAFVTEDAGTVGETYVGSDVWLMKHVHLGHDAWVGEGCELAPGTVIGGHAVLHGANRLGIGVLVLPFKQIGQGARIGAGAVVTRDVPPGEVWAGNPARRLASSPTYEGDDSWRMAPEAHGGAAGN